MNVRSLGWAVLACMAAIAANAHAATIPAGTYSYQIKHNNEVTDQKAGDWGSAPTFVTGGYDFQDDLSEPFEPEIDLQFVAFVNMNSFIFT